MPTLSGSRLLRYLVFGALYFAQGVPWGFISVGYVVFLTDRGLDNEAVGAAIGLAYVPWSFKIFWGPLIDRFPSARFGRRRPFILGAELMMGATMVPLVFLDPNTDLRLIGAVLFAHNTFAALQDVAVDALAVDILPSKETGSANSVMWASKSGGVAVGGGAGTVLAKHLGWPALFLVIACALWAVMVLVIFVRERPAGEGSEAAAQEKLSFAELKRSLSFAAPLVGIAIAFLAPAGYALTSTVTTRMFRADLKLSSEAIATISGLVTPLSGVAGALLGGVLADRLGVRRVIAGSLVAISVALASFAALKGLWPSFTFLVVWTIAVQVAIMAYGAAALGFFMSLSNPAVGATQFALFMAATNLTYSWASPAGGYLADRWGLPATFAIAAVVQLLAIGLLPLCDPRQAALRFRSSTERDVPVP
jgi:PAT family beta-lactamase induction signal transducer AmpG